MVTIHDIILASILQNEAIISLADANGYLSELRSTKWPSLAELLKSKGIVTEQILASVQEKVARALLKCRQCGKHYQAAQFTRNTPFKCPHCRVRLVVYVPPETSGQHNPTLPAQDGITTGLLVTMDLEQGPHLAHLPLEEKDAAKVVLPDLGAAFNPLSLVGQKIDHYEILGVLGQGGMGTVYKARHQFLGRYVALKVLDLGMGSLGELAERFMREAKILASLHSPHIVQVYNMGQWAQGYYIDMEFVDGQSLAERIATSGPLRIPEAITILHEVCLGLDAAHRSGIIHRDIKPENILLTKEGKVKIADFGLARLSLAPGSISRSGQIMGTPHYMSPEQAQGHKVDARSDIYSLGVMVYFMLCGRHPFHADNTMAVLYQHVHDQHIRITEIRPQVPLYLSNIIDRALAKQPEQRYPDAASLIRDLEAGDTNSAPVGLSASPRRARHRNLVRTKHHVLAPLLFLIIALLLWLLLALKR